MTIPLFRWELLRNLDQELRAAVQASERAAASGSPDEHARAACALSKVLHDLQCLETEVRKLQDAHDASLLGTAA